jgi:hypothetical protein
VCARASFDVGVCSLCLNVQTQNTAVARETTLTFLEVAERVFTKDPFRPNPASKFLAKETYISLVAEQKRPTPS